MSSYRRFVAYVYRYQNGNKGRNCGFIKVEARNGICTFYLRLQGLLQDGPCQISAFAQKENSYDMIPLGTATIQKGLLHHRVDTDRLHMGGTPYTLEQCAGIICTREGLEYYGACWANGENVPAWAPKDTSAKENNPAKEDAPSIENSENAAPEQTPIPTETQDEVDLDDTTLYQRMWVESETKPEEPTDLFHVAWAKLHESADPFDPFEESGIVEGIKIAPSDIPYLQEHNWNIGSNQFIIHGYKNYEHLLLGRVEGQNRYVLGVPGIYDQQEQFMAKMFGFPCFKPIRPCQRKSGQFGYFLRCIS